MGNGFYHIGSGYKHVTFILNHKNKIGDSRRINRSTSGWPHDGRNLRNNTTGQGIPQENIRVSAQTHNPLLDTRAAGIVEPDNWHTNFHGNIHYFHNFARVSFGQATSQNGKILTEYHYRTAINGSETGDDPIRPKPFFVQAKFPKTMAYQHIHFLKAPLIQKNF